MKLHWKPYIRIGVCIFCLYLAIYYWPAVAGLLGKLLSAASPIFIGCVIAYPLNILMGFYCRHYFPNSDRKAVKMTRAAVCLTAAILTLLAIIALVIGLVIPQLIDCFALLLVEVPHFLNAAVEQLREWNILTGELANTLSNINWQEKLSGLENVVRLVTTGVGDVFNLVVSTVSSVVSGITTAFLSIVFALYLVLGKTRLKNQCIRLIQRYMKPKWYEKLFYALRIVNDSFYKFIVGQCTEALILGSLCMLGMLLLRLPYAGMMGALVAFTSLIPVVGAFIGAAVGAFLILMQSPIQALIFIIFIIILQQLEGNIIYPRVVGSSIGLPGLWVLAAVTIGGGMLGIVGMMLGVPLAAAVYKILRNDLEKGKPAPVPAPEPDPQGSSQT